MSRDTMQMGANFVHRFFSQVYDEWITGRNSEEFPSVDACTCRALSAAVGRDVFESVLNALVTDRRITILCDFEKTEPKTIVIQLLDYSS